MLVSSIILVNNATAVVFPALLMVDNWVTDTSLTIQDGEYTSELSLLKWLKASKTPPGQRVATKIILALSALRREKFSWKAILEFDYDGSPSKKNGSGKNTLELDREAALMERRSAWKRKLGQIELFMAGSTWPSCRAVATLTDIIADVKKTMLLNEVDEHMRGKCHFKKAGGQSGQCSAETGAGAWMCLILPPPLYMRNICLSFCVKCRHL